MKNCLNCGNVLIKASRKVKGEDYSPTVRGIIGKCPSVFIDIIIVYHNEKSYYKKYYGNHYEKYYHGYGETKESSDDIKKRRHK